MVRKCDFRTERGKSTYLLSLIKSIISCSIFKRIILSLSKRKARICSINYRQRHFRWTNEYINVHKATLQVLKPFWLKTKDALPWHIWRRSLLTFADIRDWLRSFSSSTMSLRSESASSHTRLGAVHYCIERLWLLWTALLLFHLSVCWRRRFPAHPALGEWEELLPTDTFNILSETSSRRHWSAGEKTGHT